MSRPKEWLPIAARCEVCKVEFKTFKHTDGRIKRHLCSQRCAAAAAQAHRRGGSRSQPITKICEVCEVKYEAKTSYQIDKQRCCSRACFLKLLPEYKRKPKVVKICLACGKQFEVNKSSADVRVTCSRKCRGVWQTDSGLWSGENGPMWKGGSQVWWKQKARERDNFTCQVYGCDVRDEGKRTHAHHKLPREAGGPDDLDNLITLCDVHHRLLEHQLFMLFLERYPNEAALIVKELYASGDGNPKERDGEQLRADADG